MKKIIIVLLLIIVTTGCYNYVEINNLVIISGIGIDYKGDNYYVTFESLYQNKESSDSNFEKGILKNGQGKTISQAFDNLTLSLEKEPYFAHLKVVVISKEIANNHMKEFFDFFLRNNDIRNIFSLVVSSDESPEEILKSSNKYFPVASEKIKSILENNIYSNYISKNKYFKKIASNYLSEDKNISLSTIKLDNDNIILDKIIIFNNIKPVGYLNNDMSLILSIIDNNNPSSLFAINYKKNKKIAIRVYKSKTRFDIKENSFIINNNLMAEVIENSQNSNLEDKKEIEKITQEFEKLIDKKTNELINYLQENNSDILGINKKYYIKYRKQKKNYFKNSKYKVKTKLSINKKGLIFEVNNDNK